VLTALRAYSSLSSAPTLPLAEEGRADTDLIQIRDISGLGPVKINVNTTPYGSVDGESFTGTSVPLRNIVLTLGLNPNWDTWTMSKLRRLLYAYFMPKQLVRLVFESDDLPPVEIYGYVESAEPTVFSKDGEIQVSIICPDPYFTAIEPVVVTGVAGPPHDFDPVEIEYNGSVEAGFNVEISEALLPAPSEIQIQVGDPALSNFRVMATVSSTKYLIMNSVAGNKYVRNVEQGTGVITNLLSWLEDGYTWPTLKPGVNQFGVIADIGTQDWQLTYFERFGGL
jgi:hypothetical protein